MTKTIAVLFLFTLLVSCSSKGTNGAKLIDTVDTIETVKDNEDDSASIQVVRRDAPADHLSSPANDENSLEQANNSESPDVTNSSEDDKFSNLFVDVVNDSDDIILDTKTTDQEEKAFVSSAEEHTENDFTDHQEAIEIVIEQITKSHNVNEDDSLPLSEDENIWRSAENNWGSAEINNWKSEETNDWRSGENNDWRSGENVQSDHNLHEVTNGEVSLESFNNDYSEEAFMDKKIEFNVKERMDPVRPGRRERVMSPMEVRQFEPPDEHSFLDSAPMRNIAEIVVPRYRPVLTRGGIIYTPTLYTVQTAAPSLPTHGWIPNIPQIHQEREIFPRHRNPKIIGIQNYEPNPKLIDDYNDYGTNTYSYTPAIKVTTQAPPQQIIAPNRFDVFQKLAEASNQPTLTKRTFSNIPSNYFSRQFSESYGPFDIRRLPREAWNVLPFEDTST